MRKTLLHKPFKVITQKSLYYTFLSCLLLLSQSSFAQQVFPVFINGNLIPPHSLALQDYGFDKSDDIMFMMTLNDPVEETRAVKFRLTVKNNGNPIIETNPNYNPAPVILEKQIPMMLNGVDLAGYFEPLNLVRVDGGGPGGSLLPSGFNSICIEVIDMERGVPISDQFCVNGIFELAQPPILNLPLCFNEIPLEATENLMFSWVPMHLLSPNPPMGVEYEFTLVKLLPGIADPNDGFNFAIPVLQTTQSQAVLFYLQDNPPLEVGATYAWRVQAKDVFGNDLFLNGGYSNVCTFTVTDPTTPPGGGPTGLFSCGDGACDYNGTMNSFPFSGNIASGDKIAVGNFEMTVEQISNNGGIYSGTGTIYIPFIYSKLKVTFDDIQINEDQRVFIGSVKSTEDDNSLIPSMFSIDEMGSIDLASASTNFATEVLNGFSNSTAAALENHFDGSDNTHMVSFLEDVVEGAAIPIGLPIGIDKTIEETNSKLTMAISAIEFMPLNASMNAILVTKFSEDGDYVKFGARGICIQPQGVATTNPRLELLSDVSLEDLGAPLDLVGIENGESRTYLSFDCNGFEEFSLTGRYMFDEELVKPVDVAQPQVILTVQAKTKSLTDFMATVDPVGDFQFVGAEDFTFNIGEATFDFSPTENPSDIVFPENFPTEQTDETFKGFHLTNASVNLPDIFSTTTDGAIPKLLGTSILVTTSGFTGSLTAEDLINLETGDIGGWSYSMDSAFLNLVNNSFDGSGFVGKMKLPIMSDTEFLKYEGGFSMGANGLDINFDILPDVVTIDLLRASFNFDPTSKISIGRLDGKFQMPTVDLNGVLSAAVPEGDPGFVGDIMVEIDNLKDILSSAGLGDFIPNFSMEGIRFEGFKIDLNAPDKFSIGSITPQGLDLNFLGIDCDISGINFRQLALPELTEMNLSANLDPGAISRVLNFNMDFAKDLLGIAAPKIQFNLVINELPTVGGGGGGGLSIPKFEFGGFDLSFGAGDLPSFSCGENVEEITPADFQDLATEAIPDGSVLKIGHFELTPDFPLTDDGAGTISGEGIVDVPILGPLSKLKVAFTNVKVDQAGRIIEGEVVAAGLTPPDLGGLLGKIDLVKDGIAAGVDAINGFELPLVMGVTAEGEDERDQGLILMGLVFGPTEAKTKGKVVFEIGEGKYAEFSAEGLTLVPDGIANFDIAVGLASDLEFSPVEGMNPLVFKKYDNVNKTGSFVKCDCKGFQEFRLGGEYEFSKDQIVSLDNPEEAVKASFDFGTTKWGEFIGQMESMGNFTVAGLEGFDFVVSDAYLDFSSEENVIGIDFPAEYEEAADSAITNNWKGFFIREIGLTLPEAFVLTEGGARPQFSGQNLLIDSSGVSTDLVGRNIMDGEVEDWAFKMDSIGVSIVQNGLVESAIQGSVGIPIIDDELPYQGALTKDDLGFYKMNLAPQADTRLNISALRSYIDLGGQTEIVLQAIPHPTLPNKTKFKPYADLYGGVGVDVSMEDFNEFIGPDMVSVKEFIEETLGIGQFSFTPPAITFEGFKINHPVLPDTSNFRLDNYAIEGAIAIGEYELGLSQLQMLEASAMKFNLDGQEVNLPGVGLSFSIGIPLINIDLEFWAKEQTVALTGKKKFSFGKINLKTSLPKFACDGDCPEPPTDQGAVSQPVVGESFKSGDFNIKVTEANKGTVRIGFLNTELNVDFADVQLNAAGELVSGSVTTVKDAGLFAGDLISVGVEGEKIALPLMDDLTAAVNDFAKLPFSLNSFIKTATGLEEDLPFDFIVVGLRFTPEGAKLDAMVLFGTPDGTQLKFGATGLCVTPEGVNLDQIKLFIAEEISLDDFEMPLTILPGNSEGDDGSFATFSCSGLDNFHLQARYDFPKTQLVSLDPTRDTVSAYFTIKSATLGQFMANATMDKFMVAGVDDVIFEIRNANIDYSDTQNPDNFPEQYFTDLPNPLVTNNPNATAAANAQNAANGNNLWRGFFLELVSVGLPESLSSEGSDRITLEGTNLIYDKANGISANLAATNLLKLKGEQGAGETGDINGWAFSIDRLAIDVKFNSLDTFSLKGKIHIPVTAQGDEIAYEAAIGIDDNNKPTAQFTLQDIDKKYSIPFLGSSTTMDISEGSVVGIKYDAGGFQPFSDVSGAFSFALEAPEFKIDLLTFENFKINDFDMPPPPTLPNVPSVKTGGLNRMSFKGFKFAGISLPETAPDPNAAPTPEPVADPPPASPNQGNEKMGGFPINISNIKFASVTENGEDLKRLSFGLGVNFSSGKSGGGGGIAGNGSLAIYGKLNLGKLTSEPWKAVEFKKIDIGSIEIKADMGPVEMYGGLVFIKDDPIYGEGFKGLFDLKLKPSLRVEAVAQFGVTKYDHDEGQLAEDYRYFFVDGKGTFFPGVGAFGVAIYGFGGGLFYNMAKEDLQVEDAGFAIDESGDALAVSAITNADTLLTTPVQPTLSDPRLEPGVSLSGAKYFPKKGILGLKATVIAGLQNPQVLNAEATFGIEMNFETFGLRKIYFEGDAFILCKSIMDKEEASVKGSLNLEVDFNNKQLRGTMDFTVAAPFVAPIITGGGHGAMKFSFAPNLNPLENPWFVRIGTPLNPLKLQFSIPGVPIPVPKVEAYFMAGDEILDPKPLTDIYAGFSSFDIPSQSDIDYSTGAGVAFGARLFIPKKEYEFLMFTAGFEAGIGFDVNMKKYNNTECSGEPLGLAGWYMKGRAYAYLQGRVDMDVDVFFYEGRVNLCTVTAAALMQAELPNPTWMSAQIKAAGSVLDGLIEVDLQFKVEIGERCDGFGTNPLADISIITDFQPTENQDDVQVYFEPRAAFSRGVNETQFGQYKKYLAIEVINDEAEVEHRYYAPFLKNFEIRKNNANGALVSTKSPKLTNNGKGVNLAANKILEPKTWYYTKLEIGWLEYINGSWIIAKDKSVAIVEMREARFKTGNLPDKIVPEMLSYHAPGDRQRNWHKDYADPMIEFKQEGFEYIFNTSKKKWVYENGWKKVDVYYDYKYRITNLISKETDYYPLTSYPSKNNSFERFKLEWKTVPGSKYKFPVYKRYVSYGTKIRFSTLDDHLEKNKIYKIEIIGVPRTQSTTSVVAYAVEKSLAYNSDFKAKSLDNSKLKSQGADPRKVVDVLYEYHFKTSKYNSLKAKLDAMAFKRKSKGVKRNDISHPSLTTNYVIPTKINESDDYYLFASDEGFDKYDIERLRKNVRFNHAYNANKHPFETTLYYSRLKNYTYSSNWDMARSFTDSYDYEIWKYIAVNGQTLNNRFQLKNVTDKIFRKYWQDLDFGTRIQFPKNMQKYTLSDWEINNSRLSVNVNCTSCWTDGYSSSDKWSMSITMARRRVMMNQWAFMNFLENRGDAWERDNPSTVVWDSVKEFFNEVVTWFEDVWESVTSWLGSLFSKKKRVKRSKTVRKSRTVQRSRTIPGLTVGKRMRQGLDFYARDPRWMYHTGWKYYYLRSGNDYYNDYTRGGIGHAQYRRSLTNMDFYVTFYKPNYGWSKMGDKGTEVSKQFKLKDGF